MTPETIEDKLYLQTSIMQMMYLSDKYCVDQLLTDVLTWIRNNAHKAFGDDPFVDSFYQIEYYLRERCQEPMNTD